MEGFYKGYVMKYQKALLFVSILVLCNSCGLLILKSIDRKPGSGFHVNAKAIHVFKSPTHDITGEICYVVCIEIFPDEMIRRQESLKTDIEKVLGFHKLVTDNDGYIYILVPDDKLLRSFSLLASKWTKKNALTDDIIAFRDFSTPVYVVNEEGIELRHNRGKYRPTNYFFMSKTTGFQELYQHEVSETPIAPPLTHIEQIFLEQQGGEMSKDEEQ